MIKILTFGEIIWDICGDDCTLGGAGLNFAAHAGKCGAESYILSAVGKDILGSRAEREISILGVKSELLQSNAYETGKCLVTLDENAIPSYSLVENTAYDFIEINDSIISKIEALRFDAIYFGSLIQRSEKSRTSLSKLLSQIPFKEVICDVNLRKNCYSKESLSLCLENATILKISDEEESLLREMKLYSATDSTPGEITEAICKKYKNIKCVLYTLGSKGAYVYESSKENGFSGAPKPANAVSSVGAGDSFTAAFSAAYLSGRGAEESSELASSLAAYVVSSKEAIPSYSISEWKIKEH